MQTTSSILLVRPANFMFNRETAESNAFQKENTETEEVIKQRVINEFETFVNKLKAVGINTFVFDDTSHPQKPDAIFPNNWITLHEDGRVFVFPMFAPNRRYERRFAIIEELKSNFIINEIIDLTRFENENRFLEGTGSMIFDHMNKMAYACLSPRTDKELFIQFCGTIGYTPIYFSSFDQEGKEIYHTNVMMCLGEKFSVICLASISNQQEKTRVVDSLSKSGHQVIDITFEQMNQFAGNMLALQTQDQKNILVLSQSAFSSLTQLQKSDIGKYCELFPLSIPTIEAIGGGSARCMMAEIFLPKRL